MCWLEQALLLREWDVCLTRSRLQTRGSTWRTSLPLPPGLGSKDCDHLHSKQRSRLQITMNIIQTSHNRRQTQMKQGRNVLCLQSSSFNLTALSFHTKGVGDPYESGLQTANIMTSTGGVLPTDVTRECDCW